MRPRRHQLAVDLGQGCDGRVVDVRDETRLAVEVLVRRFVEALKQLAREERHLATIMARLRVDVDGSRPTWTSV